MRSLMITEYQKRCMPSIGSGIFGCAGTWINDGTAFHKCSKGLVTAVCIDWIFIYNVFKYINVCFAALFCTLTSH